MVCEDVENWSEEMMLLFKAVRQTVGGVLGGCHILVVLSWWSNRDGTVNQLFNTQLNLMVLFAYKNRHLTFLGVVNRPIAYLYFLYKDILFRSAKKSNAWFNQ